VRPGPPPPRRPSIFPAMLPLLLALQTATAQHDALRFDMTLVPADTGSHLLGETETTWRLLSPDPVAVRLDSSLRVVRVLIDGRPNTRLSRTMYGRSESDVLIPHQKRAGDSITTRVRYHGLARAGARVGANRRGERTFFATGRGDGAHFWLPVPEQTSLDRTAAAFQVQAPVAHRAIAPGSLEKVDTLPYGHAVWHYRMDAPAPIASLAVATGPYEVRSLTPGRCGDGCPAVEVWSYPGDGGESPALGRAWEMVEFFAARVGRFPYGRLAFVEVPSVATGAAPGIVFHPEGSLSAGGPADSSLALETARQWFGLAISPANPEDRWVVEGLARYLASLWGERSGDLVGAGRRDSLPDDLHGARALHRLRGMVGDPAFFGGLTRFTRDRLNQSAARADFVRSMSAAAGRDLDRDLQQAFDRAR
jgi:aminopeptidase N